MTPNDIYPTLANHAGVSAIVGDRIFPDVADDNTAAPYIVWWEVGGRADQSLRQGVHTRFHRIRIGCWAPTRAVATQIREAVIDCLCNSNLGVLVFTDADFDESTGLRRAIADVNIGE